MSINALSAQLSGKTHTCQSQWIHLLRTSTSDRGIVAIKGSNCFDFCLG